MAVAKSTIERAIEKAGGLRALGRLLDWNSGSLMRVLGGEKISPYRAGQVADYLELGRSERDQAILEALHAMSKTDAEGAYWRAVQDQAQILAKAKRLALQAWFEAGDNDPKLYETLERETFLALLKDREEAQSSKVRRKSA